MLTSIPSHIHFSSSKTCRAHARGFTLVELLISIAIITVITAIVVVRYRQFDSTVLLKGAAYEIALALREAQIQSVSAVRDVGNNFRYPRGITFTAGQTTYTSFRYKSVLLADYPPHYDISEPAPIYAEDTQTITLDKGMIINEVCIKETSIAENCGITRLDISFKRPEFKAIIYADDSGTPITGATLESAKIKLSSSVNPANVFWVTVSQLGQLSVMKQP